jgi:ferredoxin
VVDCLRVFIIVCVCVCRGDTVREVMLAGKAELYYTMKGKIWNCNGNGQCGTCKIELIGGKVTARTDAENKALKGQPATYRLACQTCVDGDITVRNKPDA